MLPECYVFFFLWFFLRKNSCKTPVDRIKLANRLDAFKLPKLQSFGFFSDLPIELTKEAMLCVFIDSETY